MSVIPTANKIKNGEKFHMKKIISLLVLSLLIFSLISCTVEQNTTVPTDTESTGAQTTDIWSKAVYTNETTLGEGEKNVSVIVRVNTHSVKINVKTNEQTLGKALVDVGLIDGDKTQYGLYITKVNGIVADFDADSAFWSLEREGVQTPTGIDSTAISDNDVFELVYTIYK